MPDWVSGFFANSLDPSNKEKLKSTHSKAVLIIEVKMKDEIVKFALTFGYGKNLIEENAIVERFGMRLVLNLIKSDDIRQVSKTNIGGSQKQSIEQLPKQASIEFFGFNIESDLLTKITGESKRKGFEGTVVGGDFFSISTEHNIDRIDNYLADLYEVYLEETYTERFPWIDQIMPVKNKGLTQKLNDKMLELINKNDETIYMASPNIIDWEEYEGFEYYKGEIMQDIDILKVKESMNEEIKSIDQLKRKKIYLILSDGNRITHCNSYNALFGELEYENKYYCINVGKWYEIENNYAKKVSESFNGIPLSEIKFDPYDHDSESSYNIDFAKNNKMVLVDQKFIYYGGLYQKVELCDLLSEDNKMIHIKRYLGSSGLSHLFNQGVNSLELIMSSDEFRNKANKKILEQGASSKFLLKSNYKYEVVFAIICKNVDRPQIPLFSKISIKHAQNRINMMNHKMTIKAITKRKFLSLK